MAKVKRLPPRSAVKSGDTWDLSSLYANDAAWERAFKQFEKKAAGYAEHRGKLATSAKALAACLKFDSTIDRLGERLGTYALSEDDRGPGQQ